MTHHRVVAVLALVEMSAAAQNSPAESPIIRTSTSLVQVNVIVHDKSGPVTGLTKEDFELTDRGKPRTISLFSAESRDRRREAALPQNTFSNRRAGRDMPTGSITTVLLDGLNTKFEDQVYAKRQLIKFLSSVDPKDHIAIYTLGKSLKVLSDFDEPERLQKILAKYRGSATTDFAIIEPDPSNTGNDALDQFIDQANQTLAEAANVDRAGLTLGAFVSIANHMADLPGRKNLVWVTGSLPFSVATVDRALNRADIAVYPVDARGLVGIPKQLTAAAPGAGKSGRPVRVPSFRPMGLATMQELADRTGGRAFYDTNDLSGAIRMAVDDGAVTYTLGFHPDSDSLDGKYHDLKVHVKRSGMNVRYRRGYVAFKDAPASDALKLGNLDIALRSPLESSSILLQARVERVKESKRDVLQIGYSIDIHNLQLISTGDLRNGAVNVFFIQQDSAGTEIDRMQEAFDIHLTKDNYETYLMSGMAFRVDLAATSNLATLRILVVDRGSAVVGTLIIPASQIH